MDIKALYTNIPNNKGIATVNETRQLHKKNIATKEITTFSPLILTLTVSFLTQSFTFKSKAVLWEQYALLHTQTYSCPSSKGDASSAAILRKA